jgi:hypothetical protein
MRPLKITGFIWVEEIVAKLVTKHRVEPHEVEELSAARQSSDSWRMGIGRARTFTSRLGRRMRGDISWPSSLEKPRITFFRSLHAT